MVTLGREIKKSNHTCTHARARAHTHIHTPYPHPGVTIDSLDPCPHSAATGHRKMGRDLRNPADPKEGKPQERQIPAGQLSLEGPRSRTCRGLEQGPAQPV